MRHLVFRLFLIAISGLMLLSYVFPWSYYDIEVPFSGNEYKLGLDLQGGIELDYKIDLEEVKKESDYSDKREGEIIEGLKSIINKRIESLNITDPDVKTADYAGEQHIIVQIPLKGNTAFENEENIAKAKAAIGKVVKIEFKERNPKFEITASGATNGEDEWIRAIDDEGRYLSDRYFSRSSVQFNEVGQPMVDLLFNDEGAEIFAQLSTRLVGQQIAIFVGGELLTAPNVNEPILGGKASITGRYTVQEANELSQDINTGVVPAPIYLTSEKTIDSKLGVSSLEKLLIAGFSGFIIIFVFLIYTYRLSGIMASVALFLYIVIVLTVFKSLGIVFTLASIAGLILSIGMAIDANILIFERIKAEISLGKSLKDATRIGFKKSWTAIWDSNVTGFIVAMILFVFGINMIKGFGLMLAVGIIISLFSAMWISRILILLLAGVIKNKVTFIGK